jgi:hypothetical protein
VRLFTVVILFQLMYLNTYPYLSVVLPIFSAPEHAVDASLPSHELLMNYTESSSESDRRLCFMCGCSCRVVNTWGDETGVPVIPLRNRGICTDCDGIVWSVWESNLAIKWCHGCLDFCQWAAFGDKRMSKCCSKCRNTSHEYFKACRMRALRVEHTTTVSPAPPKKVTRVSERLRVMGAASPDSIENAQVRDNNVATLAARRLVPSMNRCVPFQGLLSLR